MLDGVLSPCRVQVTRKHDPEMHQTKKGTEWHFGMKGHAGVDSQSRLIHSVSATAATLRAV